jgi:hypothetical protein
MTTMPLLFFRMLIGYLQTPARDQRVNLAGHVVRTMHDTVVFTPREHEKEDQT